MNVHSVLRECAADLLETEPKVSVEQVVGCAYRRHGDVFVEAQETMVLAYARTVVAKLMRDLADDDGDQLAFDGFGGLPSAIAVPTPDGTYYVRSDKATWAELEVGRHVRADNVVHAQARLSAYDETLAALRPYMENDPSITVAEALRRMGGEAA